MNREYSPRPIVCAAAIALREEAVLLVRRGHEPLKGYWSFPGGAQEPGETSRECALREVREETGLTVELLDLVEVVDLVHYDDAGALQYQYVTVDYLARMAPGVPTKPIPADDAGAAAWVPLADVTRYPLAPPTGETLEKAIILWRQRSTDSA